ncbi:hypothetical protein BC939DRAFT_461420 [Gamsiella multidivaricata]|uniref:uncharacterized protein n=1 Tax=Gamsiella multidivaricata TaxID=101098 RepID=UPI0022212A99|nr:uncharacterized protein BC939DRAFT_461420 [Gamsiella multidivaricata]KAI7818911.1 hypothetical protein BC939DRAFT_461420 [Gamsiella multidivaricata]
MIKKGQLESDREVDLTSQEPAIQVFVRANATTGRPWRLSSLSEEEHGYMTFTEIELAAFLHKMDELHPILKKLIGCTDQQRQLTQAELTQDWLSFQAPGVLIQRLITPIDPRTPDGDRLRGRQKKDLVSRQPSRLSSLTRCVPISTHSAVTVSIPEITRKRAISCKP